MLARITRCALSLRYRIEARGLAAVAERGTEGILFLANHSALIDPMILLSHLYEPFRVRPVGDREEAERPFIRWVSRRVRTIEVADPARDGTGARVVIAAGMTTAADALRAGDNLLVYPSGHIYTSRKEDLRGNSGVHALLNRAPEARVVLISLHGLWGSRFSRAQTGGRPALADIARRSILDLVRNGFLFTPRRHLTLDAEEPADLPQSAGREALNTYLEEHFNRGARANTYVPYFFLERSGPRELPDPAVVVGGEPNVDIPTGVREAVTARLHEISGIESIDDEDHLARDLGCDSLVRAELIDWAGQELGPVDSDPDAVRTVHDLMAAAAGYPLRLNAARLVPVPARWFAGERRDHDPALPAGDTIVEVFLRRALAEPRTVILADQTSGVRTYRDLLTGIFVLKPHLSALPGDRIGLMMPASVAADVLFMAILCSGKTPVMVNWTVGPRQATHGLELTGTEVILTARALVERLSAQSVAFDPFQDRFQYLEDMVATVSPTAKMSAILRAHSAPRSLLRRQPQDTAVILFTSGSESYPKAVPLSHGNLLTNLRDIAAKVPFRRKDRLLSVLPPFHSFGLTAGMLMPLLNGIPTVHSPNPRDAATLAALVGAYRATLMGGTPTFLAAMVACAGEEQLDTLRLAVTGGETCPDHHFDAFAARCPAATILEGYGITECSPIVSINSPDGHRRGTIGKVLPSLGHAVLNMESGETCAPGESGVLLVRGPSVFEGYLGRQEGTPFVTHNGRRWFNTGDVVTEDEDGYLSFRGRKRCFVKRAGEMISLPAIEAALGPLAEETTGDGPALAIVSLGNDTSSELVLCATLPLDRETANRRIRIAGLSPLHSVNRVVSMAELPVLGTGKTDYRRLEAELEQE